MVVAYLSVKTTRHSMSKKVVNQLEFKNCMHSFKTTKAHFAIATTKMQRIRHIKEGLHQWEDDMNADKCHREMNYVKTTTFRKAQLYIWERNCRKQRKIS